MSEIYEIRNRGQIVNVACQWIVTHHRLAMQLAIKPIAILAAIELLNLICVQSIPITIITIFIALLLVPTVPSMALYVAEHGEEFDYPNRTPKLMELWHLWKRYIVSAIIIGIAGGIASFLSSITMVGPYILEYITQVAIIVRHREEDTGLASSVFKAFDISFKNFTSFLMVMLGTTIITFSMTIGPLILIAIIGIYVISLISGNLIQTISQGIEEGTLIAIIIEILVVGYILASMVTMIITHFFYGHAIEDEKTRKPFTRRRRKQETED